jgi:hypothetical protein
MSIDIKKIIKAWKISFNPTESQRNLAEERLAVCLKCNKYGDYKIPICTVCSCPISKKIYSDNYDECPLSKWRDIEDNYLDSSKIKKSKSII